MWTGYRCSQFQRSPSMSSHHLDSKLQADSRRVIFLDFDGVLHPLGTLADARPPLEPVTIKERWPQALEYLGILADLLQKHPEISVVVTSSWRMFLNDQQLGQLLEPIGKWYAGSVGFPYQGRAIAIQAWLEANRVDDYLILDDQADYFPGLVEAWPTLILCNSTLGIADEQVQHRIRKWIDYGRST